MNVKDSTYWISMSPYYIKLGQTFSRHTLFLKRILPKLNLLGVMTEVNEKSATEKSTKSNGKSAKSKEKCAKTNQIVQAPDSKSNNNSRRREFQEILLSPSGILTRKLHFITCLFYFFIELKSRGLQKIEDTEKYLQSDMSVYNSVCHLLRFHVQLALVFLLLLVLMVSKNIRILLI